MARLNIVLVEPQIPQNTGNVSRTCAATGFALHLVRPLGFSTDDRYLRRAGLDYWDMLDLTYHENLDAFLEAEASDAGASLFFFTTKGGRSYAEARYWPPDGGRSYLVFGKETAGLPAWLLRENENRCFRLPMARDARSLNMSNAVAIAAYEALRQTGFVGLV